MKIREGKKVKFTNVYYKEYNFTAFKYISTIYFFRRVNSYSCQRSVWQTAYHTNAGDFMYITRFRTGFRRHNVIRSTIGYLRSLGYTMFS